jgi:Zn-dependent protease
MLIQTLLSDPISYFRIIVIIILSITFHELAHGVVAIHQGDDTPIKTEHMTPNPITHMGVESIILLCVVGLAWGAMPVNPNKFHHPRWSSVFVAAAGPLSNLGIALGSIALLNMTFAFDWTAVSPHFLFLAAWINVELFLLNLLPLPPLDGFHVICGFLPQLKVLENSPLGLVTLVILFTGGLASGLSVLAKLGICWTLSSYACS